MLPWSCCLASPCCPDHAVSVMLPWLRCLASPCCPDHAVSVMLPWSRCLASPCCPDHAVSVMLPWSRCLASPCCLGLAVLAMLSALASQPLNYRLLTPPCYRMILCGTSSTQPLPTFPTLLRTHVRSWWPAHRHLTAHGSNSVSVLSEHTLIPFQSTCLGIASSTALACRSSCHPHGAAPELEPNLEREAVGLRTRADCQQPQDLLHQGSARLDAIANLSNLSNLSAN